MSQHRTQFSFRGKREHISIVNKPNLDYTNQHIYIKIPHGLTKHVIGPEIAKFTFNIDSESTDKIGSIVNNAD